MGSLRRYDVQARYAAAIAVISLFPVLASIGITARNFNADLRQIVYRNSVYAIALLGCAAAGALGGGVAAILGFASAGQRLNDRQNLSWLGFFLGGGVATTSVVIAIAFLMLRLHQPG